MNAKELGFMFQPGDQIKVLGSDERLTVLACVLTLTGESQEVGRSYEAINRFGDRPCHAREQVVVALHEAAEKPAV